MSNANNTELIERLHAMSPAEFLSAFGRKEFTIEEVLVSFQRGSFFKGYEINDIATSTSWPC